MTALDYDIGRRPSMVRRQLMSVALNEINCGLIERFTERGKPTLLHFTLDADGMLRPCPA